MSIIVQLMSGDTYTLNIFDGYRVVHTKNEIASILKVNRDLVNISSQNEEGEFDILDNMNYVQDGEKYHAFIGEEEDPPEYYMRFDPSDDTDFEGIVIVDDQGKEVNRVLNGSILHVQLSEDGWEFVRNVLRENKDGMIYESESDSDSEYDLENNIYKEDTIREDAIRRFMNYLYNGSDYLIYIEDIEEEDN